MSIRIGVRWLVWVALAVVLALFALAALSYRALPHSDEIDFVRQTCGIAEDGGLFPFLKACFTGRFPFENKHPGIPLLLSSVAERSPAGIPLLRFANILPILVLLVVMFRVSRRRLGPLGALALVTILAVGHPWIVQARQVLAEPLFYACFFLCWLACLGHFRLGPQSRWAWAGALVGLAYMVKGSAVLFLITLPAALVLYGLLEWVRPASRSVRAWDAAGAWRRLGLQAVLFLSCFVLCASPVLVNAGLKHGNPLYNINSQWMWIDGWPQIDEVLLGRLQPSLSNFLALHGVAGLFGRAGAGLRLFAENIPNLFVSSLPLSGLLSTLWVGLSAWGWWSLRTRWARIFTATLLSVAALLYAFYAPVAEYNLRHVMTLCPVLLYLALLGLRDLWVRVRFRRGQARSALGWRRACAGGALALPVLLAGLTLYAVSPPRQVAAGTPRTDSEALLAQVNPWIRWEAVRGPRTPLAASPGYLALAGWMQKHLVEAGEAAFQTEYLCPNHQVFWLLPEEPRLYNVPAVRDFSELTALAGAHSVRYLLLEFPSWERRKALFQPYIFRVEGTLHLDLPGWKNVWIDPDRPAAYIVYERNR